MKKVLPIIAAVLFLLVIILIGKNNGKIPETPSKNVPTNLPSYISTVLSIDKPMKTSSGNFQLPISIDTGGNNVNAVQLELKYDPKVLQNVAISAAGSTFFANSQVLLQKIDRQIGTISFALANSLSGGTKTGRGVVAVVSFSALSKPGTLTTVSFLPTTQVTAPGVQMSVLKEARGIVFQVE